MLKVAAVPGQQVQDVLPHVAAAHCVVVDQLRGQLRPPGGAGRLHGPVNPADNSVPVMQGGQVTPQHRRVAGSQLYPDRKERTLSNDPSKQD